MITRALALVSACAALSGVLIAQTDLVATDRLTTASGAQANELVSQAVIDPTRTPKWQTFQSISAPGDGTIFGVATDHQVYRWKGDDWVRVEGSLTQVSAGSKSHVWGVNASHGVWQGTANGWIQRPGTMKEVRVAKGGAVVVALDLQGRPFWWNGTSWTAIPNAPVLNTIQIGGDANSLYGIGGGSQLYRWLPNKQIWAKVSGKFKKLTVGRDGTVGGITDADGAYVRSDADVTAEIEKTSNQTGWVAFPETVGELEIIDSHMALIADKDGLLIQAGAGYDAKTLVGGLLELKSDLQVSEVTPEPAQSFYSSELTLIDSSTPKVQVPVNQCAILSGTLKLNVTETVQAPVAATCTTAKFKRVSNSFTTNAISPAPMNLIGAPAMPVSSGAIDENTGLESIAKTSQFLPKRLSASAGPIVCPTRSFYDLSKHSYVTFTMPEGRYGEQIQIPSGSYNKYVFPACNRVWWTNLVFACTVNPVGGKTEWSLMFGKYDADANCTGYPGDKFYFTYGDR